MSKSIDIHLSQLRFPSACAVCMLPAAQQYELQKVLTYGRRSYTVKVNVPMCSMHFQSATCRGTAERFVDRLGMIVGSLTGLLVTTALMVNWHGTGEGNALLNLLAGSIFGLGSFVLVWAIISLTLAPLFAKRDSKDARHAVRFRRYWPKDQFVRLEFQNEQLADIVQNTYAAIDRHPVEHSPVISALEDIFRRRAR